jgi:Transposase DDE domain
LPYNTNQHNLEEVEKAVQNGDIRGIDPYHEDLVETILLKMDELGLISYLSEVFEDRRGKNAHLPISVLLALYIAARMKGKTSLTDVPFAITDSELLTKLGWDRWRPKQAEKGLMTSGALRYLIFTYESEEIIEFFNRYMQEGVKKILAASSVSSDLHILDCVKLDVLLENDNYENSAVAKEPGGTLRRGYKMATLRGILPDAGIVEEVQIGPMKVHDLELSREMIKNSPALKEGDSLICDRGFVSRELINHLKTERKVDIYMPVKANMDIFKEAVQLAQLEGKWEDHPNEKRTTQQIQQVFELGNNWRSNRPEEDISLQACVVWERAIQPKEQPIPNDPNKAEVTPDTKENSPQDLEKTPTQEPQNMGTKGSKETETVQKDQYYVFITTNLSQSAKQIIKTYELRPEIEEDFRQLKDFWGIEGFKSTNYIMIVFYIIMTLMGYNFFQLYKNQEEGEPLSHKSLPIVLERPTTSISFPKQIVIYTKRFFGKLSFIGLCELYAKCTAEVRKLLHPYLTPHQGVG